MKNLMAIILAADEDKEAKSKISKFSHRIYGKKLVEWVSISTEKAGVGECTVVNGNVKKQLKTLLTAGYECVIILFGNTPLIKAETISAVAKVHIDNENSATAAVTELGGHSKKFREKDCAFFCFDTCNMLDAIKEVDNDTSPCQDKQMIINIIDMFIKKSLKVGAVEVEDPSELLAVNDRVRLAVASEIIRKRILDHHMRLGVTIIDPGATYIDDNVEIGMDTVIYPGTIIEGKTVIGESCVIGPNSRLVGTTVGNNVEIINSVVLESFIDDDVHVGPFAYIRPESVVGKKVKIGDFVEIKKSVIGDGSKVSHLTYVGDADIGKNVNLGCGVVTINYDGNKKHKTVIGDNAFVGCNVNLVAPVKVSSNSYIAAGSTITKDVPENSLAIARERQVIIKDWVLKRKTTEEGVKK